MINVLIADDHTPVRAGLGQLLAAAGDIAVVGEAEDGSRALARLRAADVDVLVLDASIPGASAIDLIRESQAIRPGLSVLVLGTADDHYAVRAMRAGAAGYVTRHATSAQVLAAIRAVARGHAHVSVEIARLLASREAGALDGEPHHRLSDREFQVFRLIAEGRSVADIARQLDVSTKTVATHKAGLLQKMEMRSTAELIRYAITHRLVDDEGAGS